MTQLITFMYSGRLLLVMLSIAIVGSIAVVYLLFARHWRRSRADTPTPPTGGHVLRIDEAPEEEGPLAVCWFNVPLEYNNGDPVETPVLDGIRRELANRFGGYTNLGPCRGFWRREEPSLRFEVAVPEDRVPELMDHVRGVGRMLGEECMYFILHKSTVALLFTGNVAEADGTVNAAARAA